MLGVLAAVPPIMDPLYVPQEVTGGGTLRDAELNRSLCFLDQFLVKLLENVVLYGTIELNIHLNLLLLFLDNYHLLYSLNRHLPLQALELYAASLRIKDAVSVVEEHV